MCSRVLQDVPSLSALGLDLGVLIKGPTLFPLSPIALQRNGGKGREALVVTWGLLPPWAKKREDGRCCYNARSESAAEKPSFKDALRRKRCLIPVDAFYEWGYQGDVNQGLFRFEAAAGGPLWLAGLWESHPQFGLSGTILTTLPNRQIVAVGHDRCPVYVREADREAWLDPKLTDAAQVDALMHGFPEDSFRITLEQKPSPKAPKRHADPDQGSLF